MPPVRRGGGRQRPEEGDQSALRLPPPVDRRPALSLSHQPALRLADGTLIRHVPKADVELASSIAKDAISRGGRQLFERGREGQTILAHVLPDPS